VLQEYAAHPDGHYTYWRNANEDRLLLRRWVHWPEFLDPLLGGWQAGSSYEVDAIVGMGEDPYSCGECALPITEQEAQAIAEGFGLSLDAPRLAGTTP
jgi:hypothetical protein